MSCIFTLACRSPSPPIHTTWWMWAGSAASGGSGSTASTTSMPSSSSRGCPAIIKVKSTATSTTAAVSITHATTAAATATASHVNFNICFYLYLYYSVLFEDNSVNRMQESLNLFDEVLKNPLFKDTPVFLFLNKKDLFEEMIPKHPLTRCFPDYTGAAGEMQPALDYITAKFLDIAKKRCPDKKIYIHIIAARLRMDMKVAFGEVKEELKRLMNKKKK
jgi:hypothetical protein